MKKDWMIRESELDDDQRRILMATLDKSLVVIGCAGSGKSVLALIKAQRIQRERGNDYEIIVFTKALCRYMNAGRSELGLKNQFYYHVDWKKHGYPSADYVIVDEIQDFSKERIEEFIRATKKNFFFFGDTAQSIYKDTMPVENIRDLFSGAQKPKVFELYRNYRLPKPVARFVQYVGVNLDGYDESTYKSAENAKPFVLQRTNKQEQVEDVKKLIVSRSMTDVAVLIPRNVMVKDVANELGKLGLNCEVKYDVDDGMNSKNNLDFSSTNVKIMTYHSAKGLQFETVFLPYLEDFKPDGGRFQKALYVAMTRTYKYLYVMYSGAKPSILSRIPNDLYLTTTEEEIDDI